MTDPPLRIGTRGSALALAQTELVVAALRARDESVAVDVVTITTRGDVRTDVPLSVLGGRGVFAAELEQALRAGEVDLAVHSAKDLPSTLADDFVLAAFLPREDPRDVVVSRGPLLRDLPHGAIVGTSSPRRACQIRALRPDVELRDIRGNVGTRLRKLDEGAYDAIVLAAAGLRRLGLDGRVTEWLGTEAMLPSPGQGAIAIELRADDAATARIVATIDDAPTRTRVVAERAFLARLGAGCAAPAAAHATLDGDALRVEGMIGRADGMMLRASRQGLARDAESLGAEVAEALRAAGGDALLAEAGVRVGVAG
jgi:hydroxymethylbilane synthase